MSDPIQVDKLPELDESQSIVIDAQQIHRAVDVDRVTAVVRLYHEHAGDKTHEFNVAVSKLLETKEEAYTRRMTLTELWTPLRFDWPASPGLFIIENLETKFYLVNPTPEQKLLDAAKVIEVSQGAGDYWLVAPTWPFFGVPADFTKLRLRSQSGEAACRITIFPK